MASSKNCQRRFFLLLQLLWGKDSESAFGSSSDGLHGAAEIRDRLPAHVPDPQIPPLPRVRHRHGRPLRRLRPHSL